MGLFPFLKGGFPFFRSNDAIMIGINGIISGKNLAAGFIIGHLTIMIGVSAFEPVRDGPSVHMIAHAMMAVMMTTFTVFWWRRWRRITITNRRRGRRRFGLTAVLRILEFGHHSLTLVFFISQSRLKFRFRHHAIMVKIKFIEILFYLRLCFCASDRQDIGRNLFSGLLGGSLHEGGCR